MKAWVEEILACPRDGQSVIPRNGLLECPEGHVYPLVHGIPVMLIEETTPTHGAIAETLSRLRGQSWNQEAGQRLKGIHPFVLDELVKTCGNMYQRIKELHDYPIPRLPISPEIEGATLIDIGSNWGRWSFSAARNGFRVVGIDPSLTSALAGQEIARQIGVPVSFVVGDARYLPFKSNSLDVAFSYSVIQHFSRSDAQQAIHEAARVLSSDGIILIQMANRRGIRQLFNRLKQRVTADNNPFRVRYWTIRQLKAEFEQIGATSVSADGYLSLNAQVTDIELLPKRYAVVIRLSEALKKVAARWPALTEVADSVWVRTRNGAAVLPPVISSETQIK